MAIEPITFGKGLNTGNSPLVIQDGELVECSGFSFDKPGEMAARAPMYAVNGTAVGSINGLHRYINWLLLTDAGNVRYKWDLNGYCNLYTPADENFTSIGNISSGRPRFADMDDFTFIANGQDRKAFASGALYNWNIENPTTAPVGAVGAAGSTRDGTYSLYYTFYILFPNGRTYETDASPASNDVAITGGDVNKKITWSNIGTCPYSGTGVKVYRKLYRYSATLGDTYYVTTIQDNTTTTYTDDETDVALLLGYILTTTGYAPAPEGMVDVANYLQRIFGIRDNLLFYSEPYLPFAFPALNSISVTKAGEAMKNCLAWGDQLYVGWPSGWKRLQGADSDTWAIKSTFSEQGPINTHTTKKTRFGVIYQWYDGLYIFDGTVSRNITRKDLGTKLFTDIEYPAEAYAEFDGKVYRFVYASAGKVLDKVLMVDFRKYPAIRFYNNDFVPSAFEYHFQTGIGYYGKTDGYQYKDKPPSFISYGGAQIDTAKKKYGTGSISFNGTTAYLRGEPSPAWYMGTDPFTIDFWAYFTTSGSKKLFQQRFDANNYVNCLASATTLSLSVIDDGSSTVGVVCNWTMPTNTWTHIALIRGWGGNANHFVFTQDGERLADQLGGDQVYADAWPNLAAPFEIGKASNLITAEMQIDDFRIKKGTAIWTAEFTPPAAALSGADLSCDVVLHGDGNDGDVYISNSATGTETMSTAVQTGDRAMQSVITQKNLKKLYYDINTGGADVTVTLYADGVAQSPTYTLNEASRKRSFINLANYQGYHFAVRLTCSDASDVVIYEPWGLEYTPFGG